MTAERSFFRTVLLGFLGGVGFVAAANFVIDPFGMNGIFGIPLDRDTLSPLYNAPLYKLPAFDRAPSADVVFGDSRCDRFKPAYFAEAGEPGWANLSFGGATLHEILDAFWWASERVALRTVVLCIPFSTFTGGMRSQRFLDARDTLEHPAAYYLSPLVLRVSFALVVERLSGVRLRTDRPPMSEREFWQYQLGLEVAGAYRFWTEPGEVKQRLEEVVRYCREHGIALVIVTPPNHVDLQRTVEQYGLAGQYARYKAYLASLAPVIDFDRDTPLTRDRSHYGDPYHLNDAAARDATRLLVQQMQAQRTATAVR